MIAQQSTTEATESNNQLPATANRGVSRSIHLALLVPTVALGLLSRTSVAAKTWPFFAEYGGDTLWAAALFFLIGLAVGPRLPLPQRAVLAVLLSFVVECSQLYHAPWIDALRATLPGKLILGQGFLWSDLLCYACGVLLALTVELAAQRAGPVRKENGSNLQK